MIFSRVSKSAGVEVMRTKAEWATVTLMITEARAAEKRARACGTPDAPRARRFRFHRHGRERSKTRCATRIRIIDTNRSADFTTNRRPIAIDAALSKLAGRADIVVVDCLTLGTKTAADPPEERRYSDRGAQTRRRDGWRAFAASCDDEVGAGGSFRRMRMARRFRIF